MCECIPTRFSECKASTLDQTVFRNFHFGLKTPQGFTEMMSKLADVRCLSSIHFHGRASLQRFTGHVIVDLTAVDGGPIDQSNGGLGLAEHISNHVLQASPFRFCRVLMGVMGFCCLGSNHTVPQHTCPCLSNFRFGII